MVGWGGRGGRRVGHDIVGWWSAPEGRTASQSFGRTRYYSHTSTTTARSLTDHFCCLLPPTHTVLPHLVALAMSSLLCCLMRG